MTVLVMAAVAAVVLFMLILKRKGVSNPLAGMGLHVKDKVARVLARAMGRKNKSLQMKLIEMGKL